MNRYKPCPICGGNMDFRQEPSKNNDNDEMIDVFECQFCKTTFSSDGNSDLLYNYFYNGTQEDKKITVIMSYKDLTYTLVVFEDWLKDTRYPKDISKKIVERIYYSLVNIWGDNASNG